MPAVPRADHAFGRRRAEKLGVTGETRVRQQPKRLVLIAHRQERV